MEKSQRAYKPEDKMLFTDEQVLSSPYFKDVLALRFGDDIPVLHESEQDISPDILTWAEQYDMMPQRVSAGAIANLLGIHKATVVHQAELLEVRPILTESQTMHAIHGYEKEFALELHDMLESIPLQLDWLSALDLEARTGVGRKRAQKILAKLGIETKRMRANHNHRVARFYPPCAEQILLDVVAKGPKPAGDWKTESAIATLVGKDESWVRARVAPHIEDAEMRMTPGNLEELHHSPEVIAGVIAESKVAEAYPIATAEDISLRALARRVGHRDSWVLARLPYVPIAVMTKRNPANNKPSQYVSPNPEAALLAMPDDVLGVEPAEYISQPMAVVEPNAVDEQIMNEVLPLREKKVKRKAIRIALRAATQAAEAPIRQHVDYSEDEALSWQSDALCAQVDPEAFFPEKGGSAKAAKRICQSCDVAAQCLAYAMANDERFGIWGGKSERERRRLLRHTGA